MARDCVQERCAVPSRATPGPGQPVRGLPQFHHQRVAGLLEEGVGEVCPFPSLNDLVDALAPSLERFDMATTCGIIQNGRPLPGDHAAVKERMRGSRQMRTFRDGGGACMTIRVPRPIGDGLSSTGARSGFAVPVPVVIQRLRGVRNGSFQGMLPLIARMRSAARNEDRTLAPMRCTRVSR